MASVAVEQVAAALNVTPRRVQQLAKEGMPRDGRGQYDLGVCMHWYIRYLQKALEQRASGDGEGGVLGLAAERARLAREMADKTAMENAVRRGELGVVAELAEWFGGHIERARARLIQIPDAIGQFVDPRAAAGIVAHVRRLIYEALAELVADAAAHRAADCGAVGTAADDDGERVVGSETASVKRGKRRARPVAN